jgi:hypothetical protein
MASTVRTSAREFWFAALIALVAAACVIGRPLFDPERVYAAVDTATAQLPWSAAIAASERRASDPAASEPSASNQSSARPTEAHTGASHEARPRNPALSDQGLGFYPYYRWVSRSWSAGEAPSWNSYNYAGVPGWGNPQSGALDPQVALLALLERLGGERAMDWGWALLAALRLAGAGLGAYLLARELGLGRAGSVLAGCSFGLSGYLVLWLGYSLGHVPPFLPWILLGLERLRGTRQARAFALAALALAGAILGGHPETSFYVGACAGLWSLALLARERRAGWLALGALASGTLLAAPSLVPFVEYLQLSAAQAVREAHVAGGWPDLVALGLLAIGAALVVIWRAAAPPPEVHLSAHGDHGHVDERAGELEPRHALGLGLAFAGLLMLLRWRGLSGSAWLALAPDLYGMPGDGAVGYRGIGTYVEEASAWLPLPVLVLALAGLLSSGGALRRHALVAWLGACAFLLCVRAPGLLDAYRHFPVVGLGMTVRFGTVSALLLGLLAGAALERAAQSARTAAALAVACACAMPLLWSGGARAPEPGPRPDDNIGFARIPPAELDASTAELVGWVHPAVPVDSIRVRVEALDTTASGALQPRAEPPIEVPAELLAAVPALAGVGAPELASVPEGARWFRAPYLQTSRLEPGLWRFSVELLRTRDGALERLALREVRVSAIVRRPGWSVATLLFSIAAFVLVALLPAGASARPGKLAWCVVALSVAQGVWFAAGQNPAVPRGEVFPPTRTEAVLAREIGVHRYFADPLVLPPSTGLVRGLRSIQGYDGLDVAAFNELRRYAMKPGVHALLGWHPRGVDLTHPVFRLFGVKLLVLAEPLAEPGWELVAGPSGAPEPAECFVYRAANPPPRAFCVARATPIAEIGARLAARGAWDPLAEAAVERPWTAAQPFTRAEVSEPRFVGNDEVRVHAKLDGDGLLVLTEQHFPGWTVEVDGVEREMLQVDAIFRGVALGAGEHEVVFRYAPRSFRSGLLLAAVGAALALAVCAWLRVRTRTQD